MNHFDLENKLKIRIKKHRITESLVCVVFLLILIVFTILYYQSESVEETSWGPITHQNITYNIDYIWGILIGVLGFIPALIVLITDCLFLRLVTVEVNSDYITLYRGLVHTYLYVNGEQKDSIIYGYYLEADLSDGSKITVSLGKWTAHISFSNGHPSIDV